jgi:integrase
MGTIYRRQVRFCKTCHRRLDTTAAWTACESAGHDVEIREQPIWWVKYHVGGRPQQVSSNSTKKEDAKKLLREREHLVDQGAAITADVGKLRFDDAADDLVNDFKSNKKKSLRTVELRIRKHLTPFFGGRRMSAISTTLVRQFTVLRQGAGASNGEINRELSLLKRAFTLAVQAGKLMTRPYIPMLKENNVRQGFFEPAQFTSVKNHLPPHMRPIIEFAQITGWRTPSEILPLEWRQVDMKAGEVRLDSGTTKNGEGRVFPFTTELRRVLEDQQKAAELLKKADVITPFVFFFTVGEKAGKRITESGFNKAWGLARSKAGCPGRIPHDFRRTAVRNLVRAGVPERVAMQLTGHKTRAVFERYNIVSPGDLRDAARRLDAYASSSVAS